MTDHKTVSVYDARVNDYLDVINEQPVDELLLAFIARLQPDDYVLDLGCGPAISSAAMRDHGIRVDPIDASASMVELANRTFAIGARQALFEEIDSVGTYDAVWANFSLLHAPAEDFPKILQSLHRAMKPAGVFHIGMKVGEGSARDKLDRYYSYYSETELRQHLKAANFKVDGVVLGEAKGLAGDVEPWIALTSIAS